MNRPHENRVLAFDYDGVLADTEPLHWKSWIEIISPFAIDLSWKEYCRHCRGVAEIRMREALIGLHPGAARIPDFSPYLLARKKRVREWSLESPPISSQTIAMLQSLSSFRLALVTSAERSDIEPVLLRAQVLDCFEVLVFGDSVSQQKPAPEPYQLERLRIGTQGLRQFPQSLIRGSHFHIGCGVVRCHTQDFLESLDRFLLPPMHA